MPRFYALVDATPGQESSVTSSLTALQVTHIPCKERSYDFLIRFDASAFDKVDEYLQTHIRRIPGVKGVEIIVDWNDHGSAAREAKAALE